VGSVTTWRTFEHDHVYFSSFIPMSCGTDLDDSTIWQATKNYKKSDYFVFDMTGIVDFAYSYERDRATRIKASSYFTSVDASKSGNYVSA
jgi:hypothetical protein